ncbi:hypothetical protein N7513_002842 [Penicillium frequentans]|nr:hypothetical protein N7513_002842 [Penicillium glabrum]
MEEPKAFRIVPNSEDVMQRDPQFEVTWEDGDPENPRNWVIYTTMYTSGIAGIQQTFDISSDIVVLLGLTTNLFGLAIGSVILSSLSEIYGRRLIYLVSVTLFALMILPVALAKNIEAVLISRFFGGFFGGAWIASAPGSVTDVTDDKYRALAISCWSLGTMNGPVLVKETYAPALLRQRTRRIQKETDDERWWCRYDHEETGFQIVKTNMIRPLRMAVLEPICVFWNLYVGVVYAVLFLCFVAYPIVFEELRSWSPGLAGLSYCGIGTGTAIAVSLEPLIRRIISMHPKNPVTGRPAPEAAVFAVCVGSVLIPIGEFWFAWTARPPVHWICPILAGLPFGLGNGLVFIYATNYLAGSYTVYAASSLAGNSIVRYGLAGVLPLAGNRMYHAMGAEWAGTMLALIEVVLIPIPFIFYRYGNRIRMRSPMIVKGI